MNKIENFKFKFNYINNTQSERLLESVYARIFQKAFENMVNNKKLERPIIKE
jgi:hypothetical protein